MQQKTDKFVYFSKNKLCCDLLLSLCCCLLYSTLVFETISAKDAFVYSQTDQQIQEINISLDYPIFPENESLNTSRDVPTQFQHLTVLTVNNNNNNMFQHVTDTNREHYQGKTNW